MLGIVKLALFVMVLALCLVQSWADGAAWVELLGENLYQWTEDHTQVEEKSTSELLGDKNTVALYFSASWCRPCQQFTPMLAKFYAEMNKKGKKFEVVWMSQDRSTDEFAAYYQKMPWLALPVEAIQTRLPELSQLYQARGIPHLVILDEDTRVITTDGRTMVAKDPYGLEFPWKPKSLLSLVPRPLRRLITAQVQKAKASSIHFLKGLASGLAPDKVMHFMTNTLIPSVSASIVKVVNAIQARQAQR